ncbi:MAG: fumarylacetoacetate hydrolase family protein [Cellulomonadaceae bacterium]|nr:fumarylacetoacetate hydrolase family protein [Cellulomonadaceae bacterium]
MTTRAIGTATAPDADQDARFAALPGRPGKVVAVHVSYSSRADERGRRPAHPSYFLKPSSSLAASGGAAERPAGTELLAFEAEIALVIGAAARQVPVEQAWDHVGWVTAANDLGLYDLRANDRGSNVRSKGRDGFTPVGPALLDARAIDPTAIRVRAWVNGRLVQDGRTADLLFPLAQIVADLSQHLTLEPGDLILTGTPAGASVLIPGDVVEVEVDSGTTTTGRLVTTAVQGVVPFDPALGSLPDADDTQRTDAWGSREAAGLTPLLGVELAPELLDALHRAAVAGLAAQLRKRGLDLVTIDGVRPLHPDAKMVGVARTLRLLPGREDLVASHGTGYNAQKRAFDALTDGEVLVIEARGDATSGTLGDVLALRARACGAAGIVTDGGVRDIVAVTQVDLPVYTSGAHPAVLGRRHVPWETDVAIACGGTTVEPGDVIVGDADGVVVIPPRLVAEVVAATLAQEDEDAWIADQVAAGHPVQGLFPMDAEWRSRYEAWRSSNR